MGKNRRARVPSTEAAAAEMRQQARIKDETGNPAAAEGGHP